ncbi:hypothetical protein G6O67_006766 [Ophiocordyceps sinensis]|uniref:Uncharacterized protein n=1 Tax=Ophiocordyceps sinensis TaxID=72228 RepID=A0A8H4PN33_9HYPO|nr:hypothetical protein G6O67_006766 [Ophiocordyceps sinensis]
MDVAVLIFLSSSRHRWHRQCTITKISAFSVIFFKIGVETTRSLASTPLSSAAITLTRTTTTAVATGAHDDVGDLSSPRSILQNTKCYKLLYL